MCRSINVGALAPAGTPVAFTVKVASFDGTLISTNLFPASKVTPGYEAPTIFDGPGLASAGQTDPNAEWGIAGLVPGLKPLRQNGYNVVTWDPRGEFDSGGLLQLDSPAFEGKDVSALISWAATQPGVLLDKLPNPATGAPGDPRMGMVGGSYGGGIQLVTAGIDPRVDAIVPGIAWNRLNDSLYPDEAFKTSFASLLLLALVVTGSRINPELYGGIASGDLLGILSDSQQALLASSGPDFVLKNITAPTLLIQGTVDVLFPLQQAVANAEAIGSNPNVPVKMIWFCGGHGNCLTSTPEQIDAQDKLILTDTLAWLDQYVKNPGSSTAADDIPTFQWIDQHGITHSSNLMPFDTGFNKPDPLTFTGTGGQLVLYPIVGGSGPQDQAPFPESLAEGSKAGNALNVSVGVPEGTEIAGAPELTMTYSGFGTSRFVYAQLVDATGLVVGNIVTPVPVTLDGGEHTVKIPMEAISYTAEPGDSLTLQITSSATPYENFTSFGVINVSGVSLAIPTVAADATLESLTAPDLAGVA